MTEKNFAPFKKGAFEQWFRLDETFNCSYPHPLLFNPPLMAKSQDVTPPRRSVSPLWLSPLSSDLCDTSTPLTCHPTCDLSRPPHPTTDATTLLWCMATSVEKYIYSWLLWPNLWLDFLGRGRLRVESALWSHVCLIFVVVVVVGDPSH